MGKNKKRQKKELTIDTAITENHYTENNFNTFFEEISCYVNENRYYLDLICHDKASLIYIVFRKSEFTLKIRFCNDFYYLQLLKNNEISAEYNYSKTLEKKIIFYKEVIAEINTIGNISFSELYNLLCIQYPTFKISTKRNVIRFIINKQKSLVLTASKFLVCKISYQKTNTLNQHIKRIYTNNELIDLINKLIL